MGLTSTWFAVVLLIAAVGAVVAALLLWAKVRGPARCAPWPGWA